MNKKGIMSLFMIGVLVVIGILIVGIVIAQATGKLAVRPAKAGEASYKSCKVTVENPLLKDSRITQSQCEDTHNYCFINLGAGLAFFGIGQDQLQLVLQSGGKSQTQQFTLDETAETEREIGVCSLSSTGTLSLNEKQDNTYKEVMRQNVRFG